MICTTICSTPVRDAMADFNAARAMAAARRGNARAAESRFSEALRWATPKWLTDQRNTLGNERVMALLLDKGKTAMDEGRWRGARAYYAETAEIDPNNPKAHYCLALIADEGFRDRPAAIAEIRKALACPELTAAWRRRCNEILADLESRRP